MTTATTKSSDEVVRHRWGRRLDDFEVGATWEHPWEVTVDDGMAAIFQASFQDATPVFASRAVAKSLGFRERPLHPLLSLNLALSFSVHDVSEQAIAHLAYLDVRFPDAGHAGDTVTARSTVLGVRPSASGDKGVVHVRTALTAEDGRVLCAFERKALIRGGRLQGRPAPAGRPADVSPAPAPAGLDRLPRELRGTIPPARRASSLPGWLEDFRVGQRYAHGVGRTVGASEHMQLATLLRNSHPLHFDEVYSRESSFAGTRVVYGGLVFAWVAALASRDVAGHALWEVGFDQGAHPAGVVAGDTLYAASRVLAVEERGPGAGAVTFKLVGTANLPAEAAIERYGDSLFDDELGKTGERAGERVKEKVFEIRRTLLVRRRPT